jgi:hypothetical protein
MVGSGIRKKPIPDPGSGGQKGTGSRIRIRNTAFFTSQSVKIFVENNFQGSGYIYYYYTMNIGLLTYTVAHPRAVVIKSLHTIITY